MNNREQKLMKAVLIINLEVKDNHEEAAAGAKVALELCKEVHSLLDLVFIHIFMLLRLLVMCNVLKDVNKFVKRMGVIFEF